jgi:hypothetical protein
MKLPPEGARFVMPEGWAFYPAALGRTGYEPVNALVACSEACLVKLHDAKDRTKTETAPEQRR